MQKAESLQQSKNDLRRYALRLAGRGEILPVFVAASNFWRNLMFRAANPFRLNRQFREIGNNEMGLLLYRGWAKSCIRLERLQESRADLEL